LVQAIGLSCRPRQRVCNGILVHLNACLRGAPRGARGPCGAADHGAHLRACTLQARERRRTGSWCKRLSHLQKQGAAWTRYAAPNRTVYPRGRWCGNEAPGATNSLLLPGRTFTFLVASAVGEVHVRLLAVHQPLARLFSSGGAGGVLALGGCYTCRRCLQEQGAEEGSEPFSRAL